MDLWIDFNSVDDEGHTNSLVQFASEGVKLEAGTDVTVGDHEGNTCKATVVSIDSRGLVDVVLCGDAVQHKHHMARASA